MSAPHSGNSRSSYSHPIGERCSRAYLHSMDSTLTPVPAPIRYRAGDAVPRLAVYRVIHSPHRAEHFAILRAGERFPRCHRCENEVRFEITTIEPQVESDLTFHSTRIFELPHPDAAGGQLDSC